MEGRTDGITVEPVQAPAIPKRMLN